MAFFQTTAMSEMASHEVLSDDRKLQRRVFADGISTEFDRFNNLCRIQGAGGFCGDGEAPCDYLGAYRAPIGSDLDNWTLTTRQAADRRARPEIAASA